jgi:DNA invertase Pin-like site-specific DNA recombinase
MRAAVYARVPATRQAQAQTIEQQLDRLRSAVTGRGWELEDQHVQGSGPGWNPFPLPFRV